MINPRELSPVTKRLMQLPLAIAVARAVDIKALAEVQERQCTFLTPYRAVRSNYGIVDARVIRAADAAFKATAVDKASRYLACFETNTSGNK
jgi:hypothetical protein